MKGTPGGAEIFDRAAETYDTVIPFYGTVRHQADVVKTLGDGALLLGDEPSELRQVASEIITTWHLADQLPLRGVVGYGSAISEGGDLYGDLVNSASHALAYARAGHCHTLCAAPLR